jgi:hypothetical protein
MAREPVPIGVDHLLRLVVEVQRHVELSAVARDFEWCDVFGA